MAVGGALGAGHLAVGGALGAGQLALGAGDLALRAQRGGQPRFTDPADAIAGGGYNIAPPDAPGAPTRGTVSEEQFREYMRQAHQTAGEEVRRAYMQGGMDMHGYYQQTGLRVPTGEPRALAPAIRGTPAQGSGTLPVRPLTLPLTTAPVGETPAARARVWNVMKRPSLR